MRRVVLLLLCVTLASCASQSRFEWGNYEHSLYRYYKNPDNRENYRASLEKAIAKGEKNQNVAPGMMAELGFLALEDGDTATAVTLFEKEMVLFPESRPFLKRVIDRTNGNEDNATQEAEDGELIS